MLCLLRTIYKPVLNEPVWYAHQLSSVGVFSDYAIKQTNLEQSIKSASINSVV